MSHSTSRILTTHVGSLIRLARLRGAENAVASTDCGFAQGPFGRRVHPSIMRAKMRALNEGAVIASRTISGTATV